jgi:putative CocE/NonD family hydrolase
MNLFGDGLVYHSESLDADTEITGYIKLVAWMAMDVPDTDFVAELDEIKSNGTSVELTSDILRARYRDSLTEEKLVKAGEITRYEFGGFTFFSRKLSKGSRLRLFLVCPNSIQVEKNYNGGGVVAKESGKDARTAHITLYHDSAHESFLEIPIVR